MKVLTRALVCAFLLGLILSWGGAHIATLAAAPTLPPTWTPAPTETPFIEPTLPPLPTDPAGPTAVPTITPRPPLREDLFITAPIYFISKRFSDTKFIALSLPNEGDFRKLVKFDGENIIAFDVCKDGKLIYANDKGEIYAAGHAKHWKSALKTTKPLTVSTIVCSPDSKQIVFSLRADEADFAKMGGTPPTGIYLWNAVGDPVQILADKTGDPVRTNYDLLSWSPDGKLLLVNFNGGPGKPTDGMGVWNPATKEYNELFRYTISDKLRYKNALWLRDNKALLLFNTASTTDKNLISPISHLSLEGTRSVIGLYKPNAGTHAGMPEAVSAVHFMPDGRVLVLGAIRNDEGVALRNQPLQLFIGRYDGGLRMELENLGLAFRLKWPGVLLVPPSGFPSFVLDNQFGVEVFNSGRTIPFLPQEMRMGSLNNTDAYGDEFFPAYRFGPAEPILPQR